jgi:hypothetical protein
MALIWRCASQAAKNALRSRTPIQDILKATVIGWEIPEGMEPPEDATAKELAAWVRDTARPCGGDYAIKRGHGQGDV